jgi:hypothetical protein
MKMAGGPEAFAVAVHGSYKRRVPGYKTRAIHERRPFGGVSRRSLSLNSLIQFGMYRSVASASLFDEAGACRNRRRKRVLYIGGVISIHG